ncbi:MAG TPA: helix-turn-helix transcriptional regulator [Acidimicrobiales bacterium]|nr:helix-turn-helix transcriptional regulator [Acidimicrobiales bacterium]
MRSFDPEALRRARRRRRLSHDALAELVDVARPNLIAYERGTTRPGIEVLAALAGALGVDPLALTTATPRTATLADLRARAGVTKTELAARLGIARSTWDFIERGGRTLRPDTAAAVAEILGVDEAALRRALRRGIEAEAARRPPP